MPAAHVEWGRYSPGRWHGCPRRHVVWRAKGTISREAKKGCRLPHPPIQPARQVHLFHMGKTEATSRALRKGNTPALAPGQETNASPFRGRSCRCGPPRRPGRVVAVLEPGSCYPLSVGHEAESGLPLSLDASLSRSLSAWVKSLFRGSASLPGETSSGLVLLRCNRESHRLGGLGSRTVRVTAWRLEVGGVWAVRACVLRASP